ncbi:MAG: DNA methyltransferase [Anaerolineae bacterium]|nr:DNA methyltransferase [Anaerolineae bacterium]
MKRWCPPNFRLETTTVWSFKQRGDWATHDGRYRGNWSPYIPRNIILRYSQPGDLVMDYFVGGGTTAVEAKLLGRRCIARDINPQAIALTLQNLEFSPPPSLLNGKTIYEPIVEVGDARDLSSIPDESVDLICAHPPYAGIIKYSSGVPGDLSALPLPKFLKEMQRVAEESLRVLKPGGKCAILVGDARKSKHVVPIGFMLIRTFLDVGFKLKELIIKRQHNCRMTGFWYERSIHYNFLLLAHEYLPVFEKPRVTFVKEPTPVWEQSLTYRIMLEKIRQVKAEHLETTTVWIFPSERQEEEIKRNLSWRYAGNREDFLKIQFSPCWEHDSLQLPLWKNDLMLVQGLEEWDEGSFAGYRKVVKELARQVNCAYLVIEAKDFRRHNGELVPAALLLWEDLEPQKSLVLKEIIIVVPEELTSEFNAADLRIVHKYLLVYARKRP